MKKTGKLESIKDRKKGKDIIFNHFQSRKSPLSGSDVLFLYFEIRVN